MTVGSVTICPDWRSSTDCEAACESSMPTNILFGESHWLQLNERQCALEEPQSGANLHNVALDPVFVRVSHISGGA